MASELDDRIRSLAGVSFIGEAFRHVTLGLPPLSGEGARKVGRRWNPPDSFPTLYLALEFPTVIAEFHRLAKRERTSPERFLPRTVYRYAVALGECLDLRRDDALAIVGLDRDIVGSANMTACQRVGAAVHSGGYEGLLAPSATRSGTVLVIFLDQVRAHSSIQPEQISTWTTLAEVSV